MAQLSSTLPTVLVADDNPVNLELLTHILAAHNYHVLSATSGEQALAEIEKFPPDIILLDIMMPDISGYEVCRRLQADPRYRDIPILFISVLDQVKEKVRAFATGAVDYITKPFYSDEVLARVETHLRLRNIQQQLTLKNQQLEAEIQERQQREARIRLLESITANAHDLIIITDSQSIPLGPTITAVNRAFTQITQYSTQEVIGQSLHILHGPETNTWEMERIYRHLRQNKAGRAELIHYTKERTPYWVDITVSPLLDETGQCTHYIAIARDITEQKQTTNALRTTNNTLNRRVTELSTLYHVSQMVTRVTDLNQTLPAVAEIVTGIFNARGTTIALLNEDATHLTIVANHTRNPQDTKLTGYTLSVDHFPLYDENNPQHLQPYILDDPINHPFTQALAPILQARNIKRLLIAALQTQGKVLGVITVGTDRVDHVFTSNDVTFLQTIAGQVAGAVGVARLFATEQSQRQVMEQQAQKLAWANQELQERNEELNAFTRTVAHDLKAPLSSLVGLADVMFRGQTQLKPERQKRIFQDIKQLSYTMSGIVEELLMLAQIRKDEVVLSPINMEAIFQRVEIRLNRLIRKREAVIVKPSVWPTALGYEPWIEEVWVNYMSNGLKYGGKPPRLELGATLQENNQVHFWVRDNGAGIIPEAQQKLFTEFERLENLHIDGHGLGLSIVKRIIDKLGGQVTIESDPGSGSTFGFTLPTI